MRRRLGKDVAGKQGQVETGWHTEGSAQPSRLKEGLNVHPYDREQWKVFREEVIELDKGMCCQCKRKRGDGVVLQVHHKQYVSGRMPWEYVYSDCETLCKGCHAALHGKVRPSIGWHFLGQEDLGDLTGTCEYCGEAIRYVFWIQHPHWEPLGVGTVCCDNLTGTQIASNHMESIRRFHSRQSRFITSSRWRTDANVACITQKRLKIEIEKFRTGFRIWINGKIGKKDHRTMEEAKRAAFEVIENGKAEAYLRQVSKGGL